MYNNEMINQLVDFITENNGIADKEKLVDKVKTKFGLTQDGKIFYNDDFAIRFGWNGKNNCKRISNTVLGLSKIKNYDDRPLLFCIVTHEENHLLLINTTFLKKISHSSQALRIDNIRGSINCSDIMMEFENIENTPKNFRRLFAYHEGFSFQDNLERLVTSTNGIVGRTPKFNVTSIAKSAIMDSVNRAQSFIDSDDYCDLKKDLNDRVKKVQGEIAIATFINNVNLRGRIIEYLITDNGSTLKDQIISALRNNQALPSFKTEDKLGDYSKVYPFFNTETDIKTKVLFLDGNPKAYNIDKLLEFLTTDKSVYMIYILGIGDTGEITARLVSVYDPRLLGNTNVIKHWAGRNTRGVAQFIGAGLVEILNQVDSPKIDDGAAVEFLNMLIER